MTTPGPAAPRDLGAQRAGLEAALPDFLATRRWFGAKGRAIERASLADHAALDLAAGAFLAIAEVQLAGSGAEGGGAEVQHYAVPLVLRPRDAPDAAAAAAVATVGDCRVYDGLTVPAFCRSLLGAIGQGAALPSAGGGAFAFAPVGGAGTTGAAANGSSTGGALGGVDPAAARVRVMGAEQSNTSVVYDERLILKVFRRLQPGLNPDLEILRFLAEHADFRAVPRLAGWGEYRPPSGPPMSLAILQAFVPSSGDGWGWALGVLGELLAAPPDAEASDDEALARRARPSLDRIAELGRATAGLHLALAAADGVPHFSPEPIGPADIARWRAGGLASLERGLARLRASFGASASGGAATAGAGGPAAPGVERLARTVLDHQADLRAAIEGLDILTTGTVVKTRHHGDYHLGQVLDGSDGWVILDFEGEPLRPLAERRALHTPLRDVAGMLRSLDYARHAALRDAGSSASAEGDVRPAVAAAWASLARRAFLDAYLTEARRGHARFLPASEDALARALAALEGEKALYELEYELGNRPDWVAIPLAALAALVEAPGTS